MEHITEFCTGCRTCEQVCPKSCISMTFSSEGFLETFIDSSRCIDCGMCQKYCPQNNLQVNPLPQKVFAVKYRNDKELYQSASGGAFVALARYFLEHNGVCEGASYYNDWNVGHKVVRNLDDLVSLQSSKYVQSDTLQTYSEVRSLLRQGIKVLYSGTPCQIAGLNSFLGNIDKTNLLTIDLICHGVPSIKLFKSYIHWLELKYGEPITDYNFRDKSAGWGLNCKIKTKTKVRVKSCTIDPYYYHFLKGDTYRECCYRCLYSRPERVGDVTIGDFWGIESIIPEFFSKKGVSCLTLNTPKAMSLIPILDSMFSVKDVLLNNVMKFQGNLVAPTPRPDMRNSVYKLLDEKDLETFFGIVLAYPPDFKAEIKALLPEWMKKKLRKIVSTVMA